MADRGVTALAAEIQRGLADRSVAKQGEDIAAALANVHTRAKEATDRIVVAQRYREALRGERLQVGVLNPQDREACTKARTNARRVSTQLLSDDGKRQTLLTSPSLQEALVAAERSWKIVLNRANAALEAEQERLRPASLGQPIPELPNATLKVVQLKRHKERLTKKVGVSPERILELTPGDETRELRELKEAAERWDTLLAEIQVGVAEQPPEVRLFLQAVSSETGAPLELLTPGVSAWLQQENALENFVVRPS